MLLGICSRDRDLEPVGTILKGKQTQVTSRLVGILGQHRKENGRDPFGSRPIISIGCPTKIAAFLFAALLNKQLSFVLFQRTTSGLISFQAGLGRQIREEFENLVPLAVANALEAIIARLEALGPCPI